VKRRKKRKAQKGEEEKERKERQSGSVWQWVDRSKLKTKAVIRYATWNVRSMADGAKTELVVSDLAQHKVLIAGIQECRWIKEVTGYQVGEYKFWGGGGWRNGAEAAQGGVAIAVHKSLWKTIGVFALVSGRVAVMTFQAQLGKRIVFCSVWSPTNDASNGEKDLFWSEVRQALNHPDINRTTTDSLVLAGDFNGELPLNEEKMGGMEWVVGKWAPQTKTTWNDNGVRLQEEAAQMKLYTTPSQRWTFHLPNAQNKRRVYDHILVSFGDRGRVKNVVVERATLHDSDHCLVRVDMRVPHLQCKGAVRPSTTTRKLRSKQVAEKVGIALKNRFAELQCDEESIEWHDAQETIVRTAEDAKEELVPRKPWISTRTMELVEQRKTAKVELGILEVDSKRYEEAESKLKALRKKVRASARSDRRTWYEEIIVDISKAGNSGDSRKVFEGVKRIAGRRSCPPASLDGIDSGVWVKFFSKLLGQESKPQEIVGKKLQHLEAWRVCEENLKDVKCRRVWDIDLKEPEDGEVLTILKKAAKGKSVAGIIPTEFWLNCEEGRKILTSYIRKVWNGDSPPQDWLDAALCLLYKQKGLKSDPNSYRGISLLSSAEKVISMIILSRIKPSLDSALDPKQAGFTSGRSCRDAVYILSRQIERSCSDGTPVLLNFVDFKKAFDSLDWSTMWKVLAAQGMPPKIIGIIKRLYMNATISVRLNLEGKMATPFKQKVGIRQGCSLRQLLLF
jgi:exonuclease III